MTYVPIRYWTEDDLAYLAEHYGHKPMAEIARHLGRTESAVKSRATYHRLVASRRALGDELP